MTLNNIIARIKSISLAHRQVRSFYYGLASDFLTDKTTKYPAIFLQDSGGSISLGQHATTLNYKLFFVDLVHVAKDEKTNETDVHSDMISVAMDILAQLAHPNYDDWRISLDNNLQLLVEEDGDMYAGCAVDISISVQYTQNVCAVPTTLQSYTATSGQRIRITVGEDITTGELTLLLTQLPVEYNVPTDQDIVITDFLKGVVLKTTGGAQVRITANENTDTSELELILTKL